MGGSGETAPLIVRIPGSANGLSVGSPVRFNGIQYGVIRRLSIDPDSPRFVIAMTEVQANTPIYTDTRAALEIQGLTGSAYIEMQGGTPSNDNILTRAINDGRVAEITADPSSVTNLLATADDILNRANRVVGQIGRLRRRRARAADGDLEEHRDIYRRSSRQCRWHR